MARAFPKIREELTISFLKLRHMGNQDLFKGAIIRGTNFQAGQSNPRSSTLEIRIATHRDADQIAEMAIAFRNHLDRNTPSDIQFRTSVSKLISYEDAEFYLAIDNEQPIGYVLQRFRFSMWVSGIEATIEDLFVSPNQRQNGAGKRLIQFALDRAHAKGCASVCLDTNENNVASTKIYTQLGFNSLSKRWNGRQIFFRCNLPTINVAGSL